MAHEEVVGHALGGIPPDTIDVREGASARGLWQRSELDQGVPERGGDCRVVLQLRAGVVAPYDLAGDLHADRVGIEILRRERGRTLGESRGRPAVPGRDF